MSGNLDKKCRICLRPDKTGRSVDIFSTLRETEYGKVPLRFLIEEVASIEIDKIVGEPQRICKSCNLALTSSYSFRQLCIRSHKTIKTWYSNQWNAENKPAQDPLKADEYSGIEPIIDDESLKTDPIEESNVKILKPTKEVTVLTPYEPKKIEVTENNTILMTQPIVLDAAEPKTEEFKNLLKTAVNGEKWLNTLEKEKKLPKLEFKLIPHSEYIKTTLEKKFRYRDHLNEHGEFIYPRILKRQYQEAPKPTLAPSKTLCEYCGVELTSSGLQRHLMRHQGVEPFKCEVCGAAKYSLRELQNHMWTHRKRSKDTACEICGKLLLNASYKTHMQRHNKPKISKKCHLCGIMVAHERHYRKHVLTHNTDENQCEVCGCGFKRHWSLVKHLKLMHDIKIGK